MRYVYDKQDHLALVRQLGTDGLGTPYAYDGEQLRQLALTANLGAMANWPQTGQWQGTLSESPVILGLFIRDSELASAAKVAGSQGKVVIAVDSDSSTQLQLLGGSIIGSFNTAQGKTTLIQISSAGLKHLLVTGQGAGQIRVRMAGDINQDNRVDALDLAQANDAQNRQQVQANLGLRAI